MSPALLCAGRAEGEKFFVVVQRNTGTVLELIVVRVGRYFLL